MRVIFGLGNPGSEYEGTRHNIGFAVVDAIAEKMRLSFVPGKGEYEFARANTPDGFLLVKPLTFMNNSGWAVKELLQRFTVDVKDTLTIVDDFDLPLGTLRLKRRGSGGTHNGLASIIWALESEEFPRLYCGIGSEFKPADKGMTAEFVLSPFAREERQSVGEMVNRACRTAIAFGGESLQKAIEVLTTRS